VRACFPTTTTAANTTTATSTRAQELQGGALKTEGLSEPCKRRWVWQASARKKAYSAHSAGPKPNCNLKAVRQESIGHLLYLQRRLAI
jgi:hypothetical protein